MTDQEYDNWRAEKNAECEVWDLFSDLQKLAGIPRHEGSIWFKCEFAPPGMPPKMIVMPYDKLALEMENGLVPYVRYRLTSYERSQLVTLRHHVCQPYQPFLCVKCGAPTDCRGDAWEHCDPQLPGETDGEYFDRMTRPQLDAFADSGMIEAALEFVPDGDTIPYDVATVGIVLEAVQ